MARQSFDFSSFMVRWIVAVVLVLVTFNPTAMSYFHWVTTVPADNVPLKVFVGVVLVILYVIYLRATWRSLGPIGLFLAAVFFGAAIWVLLDFGILDLREQKLMTYVILVLFATILAIGISWSHVRRRVTGQLDVDETDE